MDASEPALAGRTAAAIAARRRGREERAAAMLRERGWLAIPPEGYEALPEETQQLVNAVSGG